MRDLLFGHLALSLRNAQHQKMDKHKLRAVRLCCGNGNFGTGPSVKDIFAFVCNCAADNVHNCNGLCSVFFCFAQSVKRIQSFARLADNNGKRVLVNYRIVITELGSENRFNGNAQGSTHEITGNKAGMVSRTAADDLNRIHLFQHFGSNMFKAEIDSAVRNARSNCFCNGFRLFHDFFNHKVRISALFGCTCIPVNVFVNAIYTFAVRINDGNAVLCEYCKLTLSKPVYIACMLENCGDIGRNKVLASACAYNKRAVLAHGDNLPRIILEQYPERIRALYLAFGNADSCNRVAVIAVVNKFGNNFRICLG